MFAIDSLDMVSLHNIIPKGIIINSLNHPPPCEPPSLPFPFISLSSAARTLSKANYGAPPVPTPAAADDGRTSITDLWWRRQGLI